MTTPAPAPAPAAGPAFGASGSGSAPRALSGPAPGSGAAAPSPAWQLWVVRATWVLLALPALWQLGLLVYTIVHRVAYPYDLEWMEGGMLQHAQRIHDGEGIYGPPSIDFIPYLYTPLYPGVIAVLGGVFGISFALGRMISVLSLCGLGAIIVAAIAGPAARAARAGADDRGAAWLGVVVAIGLYAAAYPFTAGWYDLARSDTFFLLLATAGLHACARWARAGAGFAGHARVAAAAALLALSFFAKQTGILYVAGGGVIVLALAWRRAPTYAAVAGAIGLGGTWILNRATAGWFYVWIHDVHQAHDFNMDRFWKSFRLQLGHFPLATALIGLGVIVVGVTAIKRRQVPAPARPLLLWTPIWMLSLVVGAIGWGTQFAVWNAYIPAMLHGAIAAGCAIVAIAACARLLLPVDWVRRRAVALAPALAVAVLPAIDLADARWHPSDYIPTAADAAAGDELVRRIAAVDGDVWVTFDPWMAHLAGKRMYTHRMGITDATTTTKGAPRSIDGLYEALRDHRFAAIVLDDRGAFGSIAAYYRADDVLPRTARPRLYIGQSRADGTPGQLAPASFWVPATATKPPIGARVLFDFESGAYDGWTAAGPAWGARPEARELPGQGPVYRFVGRYFATSMHGGDAAVGTLASPPFPIDGARISLRLAGGTDPKTLRAELWVDDKAVRSATPSEQGDSMMIVTWEVAELRGKSAKLVLVDDATGAGGHLDVDDVLIWNDPSSMPLLTGATVPGQKPAGDTPRR